MRAEDLESVPQQELDDWLLFIQMIRREEAAQRRKGAPRGSR